MMLFQPIDFTARDKLHVEANLQGPLNFTIAFIWLSCSHGEEMGSLIFPFYPWSSAPLNSRQRHQGYLSSHGCFPLFLLFLLFP